MATPRLGATWVWTTAVALAAPVAASAQATDVAATTAARPVRLDEDPVTPRMMALGGRAEAAGASTSALFGNPAMLTSSKVYHADAYTLYDPTTSRLSFGSAIVDSTRSSIAAGLSYVYTRVDGSDDKRSSHDARLNLAVPLGSVAGVGAVGRYLNTTGAPPAPGNSQLQSTGFSGFTFDAGAYVRPISALVVSASGRNLNNPNNAAAPIGLGLGVSVQPFSILTLVADALVDFRLAGTTRGRYSGGAELFLGNHYVLRAGYLYDHTRNGAQAITAGLGYLDTSFGVEAAMRQEIVPDAQTTLMISARYFHQVGQ